MSEQLALVAIRTEAHLVSAEAARLEGVAGDPAPGWVLGDDRGLSKCTRQVVDGTCVERRSSEGGERGLLPIAEL